MSACLQGEPSQKQLETFGVKTRKVEIFLDEASLEGHFY
jgi:hypothetical protein